jgi:hypothetical protein
VDSINVGCSQKIMVIVETIMLLLMSRNLLHHIPNRAQNTEYINMSGTGKIATINILKWAVFFVIELYSERNQSKDITESDVAPTFSIGSNILSNNSGNLMLYDIAEVKTCK